MKSVLEGSARRKSGLLSRIYRYRYFYFMLAPVLFMLLFFKYIPMLGIRYAFYDYSPFNLAWCGFNNFMQLFQDSMFLSALRNTLFLSLINLALSTVLSVFFALILNELVNKVYKKFAQTLLYLPHFISWVITASIFALILSPENGIVNGILTSTGHQPIYFLANEKWWTGIYIFIDKWKNTGWGTIIYLAALSGVNPELYEAAEMDGAGKFRQMWSVTLPAIQNTILVVFVLNLGKVMNLFEAVFVLQNPSVINVAETIQTYTYKIGLQQNNYGFSTAVGLFNSAVSMVLILVCNTASKKIKGRNII